MSPPAELEPLLRQTLTLGERILWHGQPDPRRLRKTFVVWLFAVPWTLFALAMEFLLGGVFFGSGPAEHGWQYAGVLVFSLFVLPFVLIGLWMLWQPIAAVRAAPRTLYVLTDRRVIRLVSGKEDSSQSVLFTQMGPIKVTRDASGWGDLKIETHSQKDSDGDRQTQTFDIMGVPEVGRLEQLIIDRIPRPSDQLANVPRSF